MEGLVAMKGYIGPLEIPELAPLLTKTVKQFADAQGLKSILWYQGDPWWFVREEVVPKEFFREVHVAAFSRGGYAYLFLMPQACKFMENAPPKVVRPKKRLHRPLKEFFPLRKGLTRKKTQEDIYTLLTQAWEEAKGLRV